MMSIARMSRTLRTVFEQDAVALARQAGLRQRTMSFTQLAYLLVLGWWKQPQAGPSALARFAGSLDVQIDKQTVDCHLTERTATWLLALLQRVVAQVVCARAIALPLLQQFRAVFLEDGSTISLPSALQSVWRGCGGSASRPGKAHAMRNELVEEFIVELEAKVMQNRTRSPSETAKPAGWRVKPAEERKKGEPAGKSGHEAPPGEASLSERRECHGYQGRVTLSPTRARWQRLLGRRTT